MILIQGKLAQRLGISSVTITRWRRKGYFGDVPRLPKPSGAGKAFHYDLEVVRAAVLKHKLRVAADAFNDLPPVE